jgi:hypothetical protein
MFWASDLEHWGEHWAVEHLNHLGQSLLDARESFGAILEAGAERGSSSRGLDHWRRDGSRNWRQQSD